jgi:hypothetical protein
MHHRPFALLAPHGGGADCWVGHYRIMSSHVSRGTERHGTGQTARDWGRGRTAEDIAELGGDCMYVMQAKKKVHEAVRHKKINS